MAFVPSLSALRDERCSQRSRAGRVSHPHVGYESKLHFVCPLTLRRRNVDAEETVLKAIRNAFDLGSGYVGRGKTPLVWTCDVTVCKSLTIRARRYKHHLDLVADKDWVASAAREYARARHCRSVYEAVLELRMELSKGHAAVEMARLGCTTPGSCRLFEKATLLSAICLPVCSNIGPPGVAEASPAM